MLQINFIRDNYDAVVAGLRKRNYTDEDIAILQTVLQTDDLRRKAQQEVEHIKARKNQLSDEIGALYKQGDKVTADTRKADVAALKAQEDTLAAQAKEAAAQVEHLLLTLPNIPHSSVPFGKTPDDNEVYKAWADALPELPTTALPHWELAKKHNIIDFELGVKITGSGFPVYRGKGAKLQRALISFFLDEAIAAGYEEILPPHMVNEETARATGQLPDKEGQMYFMEKDNLYMIPTAEVPVTNVYRDVMVQEADLPIKMTGYTPCFRREAGSYGAHVRGLNRVHQFDKVEIVQIAHPQHSYDVLHNMLTHVSGLLDKLELPYRILRLCGGDMSFSSALTYDFEVYAAAQKRWLEVSSVSNFETFQSNRLKCRFKDANGKTQLVHTLNGSALALARIVAALLENNQTAEGIVLPKVLHSYTGFRTI